MTNLFPEHKRDRAAKKKELPFPEHARREVSAKAKGRRTHPGALRAKCSKLSRLRCARIEGGLDFCKNGAYKRAHNWSFSNARQTQGV
jgi:hypothetical protein